MKKTRFKFRIWNTEDNFFEEYFYFHADGSIYDGDMNHICHHIVMQSTGLLDVDGQAIFEGDIVRMEVKVIDPENLAQVKNTYIVVGVVVWNTNGATSGGWYIKNKDGWLLLSGGKVTTVLGNKYEHPEVLEASK